jgi:hypothetical protein
LLRLGWSISLIVFFKSYVSFAQSFASGSHFEVTTHEGTLILNCWDSGRQHQHCAAETLRPSIEDHFVFPGAPSADTVELEARHPSGTSTNKSDRFDNQNKKSRGKFNLWRKGLFEQPLLKSGQNRVTYRLKRDNSVVAAGEFTVWVRQGGHWECPTETDNDPGEENCHNPGFNCPSYFRRVGYLCTEQKQ